MICQKNLTPASSPASEDKPNQPPAPPPVVATENSAADRRAARQAYKNKWRLEHPKSGAASARLWRIKNKAHKAEMLRLWRKKNPTRDKEWQRKRRTSNIDAAREYERTWRRNNRDKCRIYEANYQGKHQAEYRASLAVRNRLLKAKRKNAPHTPDASVAIRKITSRKIGKCFYCGERRKLIVEHIKPIARGGHHSAFNLVGACAKCNASKWAHHPNDFIKTGQLLIAY